MTDHQFTPEQVALVVEHAGLSLDRPIREQLEPPPEPEPETPERALANALRDAQSKWLTIGGDHA